MSNNLVGLDGKPVVGDKVTQQIPTVKWGKFKFPVREVTDHAVQKAEPRALIAALAMQDRDSSNLLWTGLYAIAKDIYSRGPGSNEFLDLVESMGLILSDAAGNKIDVATELRNISK